MTQFSSLSLNDRARFAQRFADLLGNGVPHDLALSSAARAIPNPRLHTAVENVRVALQAKDALEDILARPEFTPLFDPLLVAFLRLGRQEDSLTTSLTELVELYSWQLSIHNRLRQGLRLPSILGVLCLAVMSFILPNVVLTFMTLPNSTVVTP